MKNQTFTYTASVVLLLAASMANAQDYPASDFQPKVLYRSEAVEIAAKPASSPCDANQAQAPAAKVEQTGFDAKYPAASFQPKVVFSSTDAKGS